MAKKDKVQEAIESTETEATTEAPVLTEQDIAIRAAFDDNQGAEEEVIKMAMLQAGCKIKAVARMFNTFMIDSGQMATNEEKKDVLDATLPGMDLSSEDGFESAVSAVKADVTGATDKSAAAMVRAWAKKAEVEVFKKAPGAPRTDTFTHKFNEALIANPRMTEKECDVILAEGSGTSSAKSYFQNLRKLGNSIAASFDVADAA